MTTKKTMKWSEQCPSRKKLTKTNIRLRKSQKVCSEKNADNQSKKHIMQCRHGKYKKEGNEQYDIELSSVI